ncbi:MAG: hypothetical protein DM484_10530 [Candidatus Methylumidiphilus alinenensis]|uniref:Uncharacterized protein n=1 Tax=Candidatus Methylumidiphilus alinenensis TaxID=2202197 RepID=A0A2W4RA04_9GAMM|nr:MAG: hypothetical protein DM484_10530 [Candidatus Methylumidiphilus alinenensis]
MCDNEILQTKIFNSVHELPKEQWNGLLIGNSSTFSYDFLEIVETSQLNDFEYKYILFYDDDNSPVALTVFYTITTDIAIFSSGKLKSLLHSVRQVFPNFLKLRMLECGTPITLNSPPIVSNKKVPAFDIIRTLDKLLMKAAKENNNIIIVIRDFEPKTKPMQSNLSELGYCFVDGLPNTYIDIIWKNPKDYVSSMKSYYRSKLLRHLRKVEGQKLRYELVEDFADMAEVLCAQWLVVHNSADEFQREVLTPEFYRDLSIKMGDCSKVLLFYKQELLVGHALLLIDGDLLRWLYFGRNESTNDSLYIYAGHKVIETAINLGAKQLKLGLTTYSIKQDIGATVTSIKLAIKSKYFIINPFIKKIYQLINNTPVINNKSIFKNSLHTSKNS